MTEETAITETQTQEQALVAQQNAAAAIMGAIGGSGSKFLPRLQFMSANSKLCKSGDFTINHFASATGTKIEDLTDLGETVDIHILALRPKAVDISDPDDRKTTFDMACDAKGQPTGLFLEIMDRADLKGDLKIDGTMYGAEYLIYESSTKQYMTFFCNNPTLRNESGQFTARLGSKATLTKQKIEMTKFTYYSAKVHDCTTMFELPAQEEISEQITKFMTEKPQVKEAVDEAAAAATSREQ